VSTSYLNDIDKTALLDSSVKIGKGNYIGPYTIISGDVEIGDNNWIGPHSYIGSPPEHKEFHRYPKENRNFLGIKIGSENVIKEGVSIQLGSEKDTEVGNNNFIMHGAHIAHDALLLDNITISPYVVIAGHCKIGSKANIGISASIHQRKVVGGLTFIGMNSAVNKNCLPFSIYANVPATRFHFNIIGLERSGIALGDWTQRFLLKQRDWSLEEFPEEIAVFLKEYLRLLDS
jgi:UDP-N-acetylglucosamine acyltransferase